MIMYDKILIYSLFMFNLSKKKIMIQMFGTKAGNKGV